MTKRMGLEKKVGSGLQNDEKNWGQIAILPSRILALQGFPFAANETTLLKQQPGQVGDFGQPRGLKAVPCIVGVREGNTDVQ